MKPSDSRANDASVIKEYHPVKYETKQTKQFLNAEYKKVNIKNHSIKLSRIPQSLH